MRTLEFLRAILVGGRGIPFHVDQWIDWQTEKSQALGVGLI